MERGRVQELGHDSQESFTKSKNRFRSRSRPRPNTTDTFDRLWRPTNGPHASPRRPLIDQVTNKWREEKSYTEEAFVGDDEFLTCDLDEETSCPNVTYRYLNKPHIRKMIIILALLALAIYFIWSRYVRPHIQTEWDFKQGFVMQANGTYGIARGGDGKDMIRVQDLDPDLIPGGKWDPDGRRRLVFVGDVHGCKDELLDLLRKVDFSEETDHLILTGDVVSKGPDNAGVLDELIRLKATSVRGNHEDRLLTAANSVLSSGVLPVSTAASSKGAAKDDALLRELKPRHLEYLREMPLMLQISALPMASAPSRKDKSPIAEHILVVHAGLVPGVPLARQDPYFVMNMRSINHKTHVPSANRSGEKDDGKKNESKPWFEIWNWYNDRLSRGRSLRSFDADDADDEATKPTYWSRLQGFWLNVWASRKSVPKPQVVIYGHDSKADLQIQRWSKGLDSACVAGGKLTALVLDAQGAQKIVSTGCKDYRD